MADTLYNVIYRGKLLQGFDFETAKRNLIKMFSLSEEKAEKILKSSRVVLKKNVDESTAKKFGVALKKAGLDVALTKSPPKVSPQEATPAPALKKVVPPSCRPSYSSLHCIQPGTNYRGHFRPGDHSDLSLAGGTLPGL